MSFDRIFKFKFSKTFIIKSPLALQLTFPLILATLHFTTPSIFASRHWLVVEITSPSYYSFLFFLEIRDFIVVRDKELRKKSIKVHALDGK